MWVNLHRKIAKTIQAHLVYYREADMSSRDAFRAGWYINAAVDDQPAEYLEGCEEVDWQEYRKTKL